MSDTYVTLHGWVGSDVNFREPHGISVASFRVGATARLKKEGKWIDGDTTWYSVTTWRQLAENVRTSVQKGDAVIVHGRLRTDSWAREGGERMTALAIEANLVGHDLCRGTSAFVRTPRPEQKDSTEVDNELAEMHQQLQEADSPRLDQWGFPLQPEVRRDEPSDSPASDSPASDAPAA